ncbi:hypothetical protein BU24DRAFT_423849 [Aaosphaeria arxii CBS 175.79]|uniref:Uncharacterized protein n=1 Tax=Aaosphaeria arxii CBS 175.79 TaxID=1450172 RepID=A0A6A5XP60_9PLEO|nr:uncharacterized protein BU24DRAFT_423849 [Aaosphaeria arxii CBS 175.79]KAF2014932.1 hypothetical protein BU24DRAFT_423849 [Aaosphaeria arxii CBS 175.79]
MAQPSPSEFLTFYRRTTLSTSLRYATASTTSRSATLRPVQATYARQFTLTSRNLKSQYHEDEHATKKVKQGDAHDVQSSNAKAGIDSAKKSGTGGHATEQRDSAGGKAKAKREHPEAPDPAIGMQDERGGRGA